MPFTNPADKTAENKKKKKKTSFAGSPNLLFFNFINQINNILQILIVTKLIFNLNNLQLIIIIKILMQSNRLPQQAITYNTRACLQNPLIILCSLSPSSALSRLGKQMLSPESQIRSTCIQNQCAWQGVAFFYRGRTQVLGQRFEICKHGFSIINGFR